jgi:HEPN domain-containing protein
MMPETEEWVQKGEGNWNVANRELTTDTPVWDVICFLAQQCAEHYLKGYLEEHGIRFRKTHNLVMLHGLSGGGLTELDGLVQDLDSLTTLGIEVRYPGMNADEHVANDLVRIAGEVRSVVRSKLGLS